MLNTQDLKYFHELTILKSYTKTAKKFGVSQPTITAAIKRLENRLGGKFIIRDQSHKNIIITDLGLQFDEHAQAILNEIKVAEKEIKRAAIRNIPFGLPPIIGRNYFPLCAPKLLKAGILSHLNVVETGSYELSQMLEMGTINFALLGLTDLNVDSDLELEVIKQYSMQIIVGKDSILAQKKSIDIQDIAGRNFIELNNDYVHTQALNKMLKKNRVQVNTIYRSPDVRVVKNLVAQNLGISYLTTLAIDPTDNIVAVPLTDKNQPKFILVAAKRKNYLMDQYEEKLWRILNEEY